MQATPFSRDELWAIAHAYRHLYEEHAHSTSTSIRRKLHARLIELREHFERVLAEAVPDEDLRRAWREHLSGRAPAPEEPRDVSPLRFRGRSEIGSEVIVREGPDAELAIEVDGAIYDRVRGLDLVADPGGMVLRVGALPGFRETFAAPSEAIEALRAWLDRRGQEPPWLWARELAAEGLIDRQFALTPRGRRALEMPAAA